LARVDRIKEKQDWLTVINPTYVVDQIVAWHRRHEYLHPHFPMPNRYPSRVPASRIGCTIVMTPYEVFFGHNTVAFTT
jgi:hypothetical protein